MTHENMSKELSFEWVEKFRELLPMPGDSYAEADRKFIALDEYIQAESGGAFGYDGDSGAVVQRGHASWGYVFEVVRRIGRFCIIIAAPKLRGGRLKEPYEGRALMYSGYEQEHDAVRVLGYTGRRRADYPGYDGWHMDPDELESVTGLRRRDGTWIEPLHIEWE